MIIKVPFDKTRPYHLPRAERVTKKKLINTMSYSKDLAAGKQHVGNVPVVAPCGPCKSSGKVDYPPTWRMTIWNFCPSSEVPCMAQVAGFNLLSGHSNMGR